MRVTILGAGTAIPSIGYSPAGLYVRIGHEHLLLDAGAGTLQRLHRAGTKVQQLNRVFFTHFHPDHCLDLVSVLFAMRIPQIKRTKPLFLYGPRGLSRLYRSLNTAFHGVLAPRNYRLMMHEVSRATTLRGQGFLVKTQPMSHAAPCFGYRIESGGRVVAYSGDTDVCDGVIELGRGADLLILECSMTDERKVTGHLTPSECGRIAAQAGCRHLVLTHFYPVFARYDLRAKVRKAFRGRLTLARDFTTVRV